LQTEGIRDHPAILKQHWRHRTRRDDW